MGKKDFMRDVAAGAGVTMATVEAVIKSAAKVAANTLAAEGEVKLPDIALLQIKDYAARPGRNPKTGEPVQVPAARRIRMRPVASLVDAFNNRVALGTE